MTLGARRERTSRVMRPAGCGALARAHDDVRFTYDLGGAPGASRSNWTLPSGIRPADELSKLTRAVRPTDRVLVLRP
jgi:hypothetical protein